MKILITSLFLSCIFALGMAQNTYYVSLTGDDTNTGLSSSQSWRTITYAASSSSPVSPGDMVYIKAGDYGNENVIFQTNGTLTDSILFEGYKTTPGDNPDLQWEYSSNQNFDASIMPLLDGGDRTTGIGITMHSREYIIVKNIQIRNYEMGLYAWSADHLRINNILTMTTGDVNADYNGKGIVFGSEAYYNTLENCVVLNSCAEGISIGGDNNHVKDCRVYADDNSTGHKSAMDYYLITAGNNNTIENCHVERIGELDHNGHGINLKGDCENNQIINCTSKGMGTGGFQLRHRGVKNNLVENCIAMNCGFSIRDGASNNIIRNCKSINATWNAVNFFDTSEDDGAQYAGKYNVFENCIFQNPNDALISFMYYDQATVCDSNTFVNCVFDGGDYLFTCDRENNANKMANCIVTNVRNYYRTQEHQSTAYDLNFDFEYTDFYNNGFSAPTGINITTFDPEYVDTVSHDYHLTATSPCIDAGTTNGAPTTDFDGNPRPQGTGVDLGAYEYEIISNSENYDYNSFVSVYPNPVSDLLSIEIDNCNASSFSVEITNVSGKIVLRKQGFSQGESLNMKNFPKGIYLLKLRTENQSYLKKIVKN